MFYCHRKSGHFVCYGFTGTMWKREPEYDIHLGFRVIINE